MPSHINPSVTVGVDLLVSGYNSIKLAQTQKSSDCMFKEHCYNKKGQ